LFEDKLRQISKRWKWNAVIRTAYEHWIVLNEYDVDSDDLSMSSDGVSSQDGLDMSSLSSCGLSVPSDVDEMDAHAHATSSLYQQESDASPRDQRRQTSGEQGARMCWEAISLPAVYKLSAQMSALPRERPRPLNAPGTAAAASKSALEVTRFLSSATCPCFLSRAFLSLASCPSPCHVFLSVAFSTLLCILLYACDKLLACNGK
jgi:hypothetical protein